MSTITIFFGEMGCGKSYSALRYAERHGFKFFEGDTAITPRMLELVKQFKPLPRDVVKGYVEHLCDKIVEQALGCAHLVVAQALYLNEDRQFLKAHLEALGYNVRMWHVKVQPWRNFQNLLSRDRPWKWVYYWLMNKPFFQKPNHEYQVYYNYY